MTISKALLLSGLVAVSGFCQEKPVYVRAGLISTMGDWRNHAGGQALGYSMEAGYKFAFNEELISFGLYGGLVGNKGDERNVDPFPFTNDATQSIPVYRAKHKLQAWRLGADVLFQTPFTKLTAYAGVNVNGWKETRTVVGTPTTYDLPKDTRGKLGFRVGAEYAFTKQISVSMDYNASAWRSDVESEVVKGITTVNPSWIGISAQYRF